MRSAQKHLAALALLALAAFTAAGQQSQFSFTRYDVKDGLAGSVVNGICQDRQGFLWFATETGLSRFDGKNFKNFTTADGLPSNEVLGVLADSVNRIWIHTFKNEAAFYYRGKIFSGANHPGLAALHLTDILRGGATDNEGRMVIPSASILLTFDLSGNLVKKEECNYFSQLPTASAHQLAAGAQQKESIFLRKNNYWQLQKRNDPVLVYKNLTGDLVIQNSDSLYICSPGKSIYRMQLPRAFNELITLNNSIVAFKIHTGGCLLLNIHAPGQLQHCLPQELVNQAWADTEGNFWFSTKGSGVFKLGSLAVKNYQLPQHQLPRPAINISKWKDRIYVGTDNGQFWQLLPASGLLQPVAEELAPPGILPAAHTITSLLHSRRILHPHQTLYNKSRSKMHNLAFNSIKTISLAGSNILAATNAGVFRYPAYGAGHLDILYPHRGTCAIQSGGYYFIGTLQGLYILDSSKHSFFAGAVHPALSGRIGSFEVSPDGTIWIASYSDGVAAWKDGKVTAHLTTANGLSSNNCQSLFISGGNLWAGTEKGINKIDISGHTPVVLEKYGTPDGLASGTINTLYADGPTIYAGTPAGLSVFNENELKRSPSCRLHITGIYVSGKAVTADTAFLQLSHTDNDIRFEYAGISFRSEGRIHYRYRLTGLDTSWRQTTGNTLSFPSLASGEYRLELQAINDYGLHSNTEVRSFAITPLLTEKTWFRAACLLLLGLLLWLLLYLRVRHIRKKERQQAALGRRLAELEQMALRSQMNPHFIYNSLNAVYQYVMDKDLAGASRFIGDFSQLIRLTFELTAMPKITAAEELQYLHTFLELEKVKHEDRFSYIFSIMPGLDTAAYFLPPLVLQPYVENSIRHGVSQAAANGLITISMLTENNDFVCRIDDNGIGRKAAEEAMRKNKAHPSRGMSLTAERLSVWSKQAGVPVRLVITDKNDAAGNALGTCITLYIPISEALNPF